MRSRLAPKLEVGAASKISQLEEGERPLQGSDDGKDPGEDETRQRSDDVGEPERERQQPDRCGCKPRSDRPRRIEPVATVDA